MQDIVFYAAANETLGVIRDYANERNSPAPVLTLGVSVCLRMRLFSSTEGATPYPIASLNGISDWQWCMDSDFDRDTACKLVADAGGISVHTETDTVNGETMSFTEFVIPISNMNTEELAAWLGNEKMKPGLTGELVGYDSYGNAAFVLQIENFSVRNRVAGLGDPTVLDQETVTRTQAELMIQTAVSTSAATKQDKLTSANAGTGISITSSGIISTANVPQSAVLGLSETLAAKQNNITAGYRMVLVNGSTVDQARYFTIEPAITAPANNTTTVVLSAGKAYEIHAVANQAKVLLNRENPPSARTFGLEGHAEIFVANTGYIQTGANVVLANALEPDAVNNCTVRFHDGLAIISVEDHVAGYIVVSATGSTAGTLPYALGSASQEYVAFDATLNGQTLDMGGATTNSEKHVVGNGYTETIVSGGINCTSKTTFANLGMNGVVVSSGTLTLGDAYIPAGSTVGISRDLPANTSSYHIVAERIHGDVGTIDVGGDHMVKLVGSMVGVVITGYTGTHYSGIGAVRAEDGNNQLISGCTFSGNRGTTFGCCIAQNQSSSCTIESCRFTDNANMQVYTYNGTISIKDCIFEDATVNVQLQTADGNAILIGSNRFSGIIAGAGSVTISGGAIVDLTGNTNAGPIAPGGGITFESGGATVKVGDSTASSSYMMDNMELPAGAKLTNTAVVELSGSFVTISSLASATGCAFHGGSNAAAGGNMLITTSNGNGTFTSCIFTSGNANVAGGLDCNVSGTCVLTDCTVSGNHAITAGGGLACTAFGSLTLNNCNVYGNSCNDLGAGKDVWTNMPIEINGGTFGDIALQDTGALNVSGTVRFDSVHTRIGQTGGSVTLTSGTIVDLTGNTNAVPIKPGGGVTFAPGGATVYPFAGSASAYTLGGMTVPQIGNTVDVNLGGTNLAPSDGGFAKNVRFTSMAAATAVEAVMDTNISFDGCEFVNPGSATTIAARTRAIINLSDCALNSCSLKVGNSGAFVFAGSNTFTGKFVDQASGGVIISSGAVLDLTGNANTAPIYPGGGITLYGGVLNQPTTIIYSSGGNVGSRTFEDLEIQGATITKLGLVYGATVYSLAGDDHEIIYTEDNGATSSSVFISGETVYVVPGALMKVANT